MKLKRIFSIFLIITFMTGFAANLPISAATLGDEYSIANEYIKYTIHARTGGFCIETKDGHPLKSFDNNIPLLYKEDNSRSNGTSFTTIRIDGKDYIFGQEYGWFGIDTKLHQPVVSDEGRLLTVAWDIKGYTVTQKVAISLDENNPLCGNVGISYTVTNKSGAAGNVGIRLLLDNALDSNIDAPYVMVNQVSPTIVETEFHEVPQQIRYMDSLSSPDKMAYALLDGWSGQSNIMVDKVIVGHWVNLANTRYHYEPNPSCDFSNYSNEYLVPDTATAFYWSEKTLNAGESRTAEMLYGIGNFAHQTEKQRLSIGMNAEKIELDSTKKAYVNDGKFKLTITLDNSVDGARRLLEPLVTISVSEGLRFAKTGTQEYAVRISGGLDIGSVYDIPDVEIIADKQAQITSRRIVASVSATEVVDEDTQQFVEYSSSCNVLLPAVGGILPEVAMNQISPDTVYYEGDKNVTISGDMKNLSEALAGSDGWSLYLVSASTKESILIEKKNISFIDQGKTMSFSTNEQLAVGKYDIEFRFTNRQLMDSFGKKIKASVTLNVSNDPRDKCVSYGIVSMVRFEHPSNHRQTYDFVSFANEEALTAFTEGKTVKNGLVHKNIRFEDSSEILLTIRGKLRQLTDGDGKPFYQAGKADGDITINNILTYCGDEPLKLTADKEEGAVVSGDGTIKVINSINVWHNKWEFRGQNGTKYTLDQDEVEDNNGNVFELALVGAGSMIQYIGGFLIDLKYGIMTEDDGLYGISFGGKITLPIKAPDKGGEKGSDKNGDKSYDDDLDDGEISAAVDDVLFGQKDDGVGFLGINTTLTVKLPEDVLGSMVKNAFGVEAEVTINTIENYYRVAFGLELTMLECEGVIAFKQVPIKSIPRIVPDELFFYLGGDIIQVPIVPPFVFMTGLGGGVSDLADTVGDNVMKQLPPITIHLKTQLLLIETLEGDFELEVKLSGLRFDGELKLRGDDDGKIFVMKCGMAVQWVSPFYMSAYGDISICEGLLQGGFTIKISENYFYGYVYAGLFIPESIPLVGGMQLAGVEAAISSDFIGANVAIIGIKFGFIYYWDGEYKFGRGIDLSSRGGAVTYGSADVQGHSGSLVPSTMAYGTNLRRLPSVPIAKTRAGSGITKSFDPVGQNALLFEIPLRGTAKPQASEIILTDPNGKRITMIENDGDGGGNYLIQARDDKYYLYITITSPEQLIAGNWTLSVTTENVYIDNFEVNGVDYLPEFTGVFFTHADPQSREVKVSWTTDAQSDFTGTLNVYVTKDAGIMSKLENSSINDTTNLISIGNVELNKISSGHHTFTLPDTFEEGEYYVIAMLSNHQGGMSKAMSASSFKFVNPLLPGKPESVSLSYAGNGFVQVNVTNNSASPANYYMVSLLDETGEEVQDSFGKYGKDDKILLRPMYKNSNKPVLEPGKTYFTKVIALREETSTTGETLYYYGTESTVSQAFVMPDTNYARLTEMSTNLPKTEEIYTNNPVFEATYTFDMPVKMTVLVDGVRQSLMDEYKTQWTVQKSFDDGLHLVDFEVVNEQGDRLIGSKSGGAIGFTVDTTAPVLTVGQTASASMEKDAPENAVSNQTVFVSEDGSYMLNGLTEKSAKLTLDDTTDGITVNDDGTFSISRHTDSAEPNQILLLKAEDLAGNTTELQIYLVNRVLTQYESIKLISDLENASQQPDYIEMSVGHKTYLTAKGLSAGRETLLKPEDIVWEVLYEHNIIKLSQDGLLEAVAPGETAVKVSYRLAAIEGENGQKIYNELSDVIKIKIRDVGYRFELRQTQGFTLLTLYTQGNQGTITVQVNGETVTLLYDESKKAYMGAFRRRLTGEQIMEHIVLDATVKPPVILRGDINGDGILDKVDVNATVDAILNNIYSAFDSAESWLKADKNGDGVVNISDAQLTLKEALK